jgi:hypothetical protein
MLQLAVARIPHSAPRLLIMLWHLADRWGRWEKGRIVLPIPLTHKLLGALISVRREQITRTALPALLKSGRVARNRDGFYELLGAPPEGLDLRGICEAVASSD